CSNGSRPACPSKRARRGRGGSETPALTTPGASTCVCPAPMPDASPSTNDRARAVVDHFDGYSSSGFWSALYASENGKTYHFHTRRRRILELLPERLGDVLDVGCGPGVM